VQESRLFPFRRKNQRPPEVPEVARERTGGLIRSFLLLAVVPQVLLEDIPVAKRGARVVREPPAEQGDEIGGGREIQGQAGISSLPSLTPSKRIVER
jgi:hypothetical protein